MASAGVFRDMGVNRQLLGVAASYSPLPLASAYASVWAALAACAALYRGVKTGRPTGESIEVPLASALLETLCHNSIELEALPARYLSARQRALATAASSTSDYYDVQALLDPFYASYTCRDARPFYLVCPSHQAHQCRCIDAMGLRAAVEALGVPVADAYAGGEEGSIGKSCHGLGAGQVGDAHAAGLRKLLRAAFLTRTAFEWEALLGAAGVPGAAHRSTAEWLCSPHAIEAGLVVGGRSAEGETPVRPCPIAWVVEATEKACEGTEATTKQAATASPRGKVTARALAPVANDGRASSRPRARTSERHVGRGRGRGGRRGLSPTALPADDRQAVQGRGDRRGAQGAVARRAAAPAAAVVCAPGPPTPRLWAAERRLTGQEEEHKGRADGGEPGGPGLDASAQSALHHPPWLAGVRVLDMANVIAGPTIGAMLARLGAEVDKVDPVTPTYSPDTTVLYGLAANAGKRSTLLDVTDDVHGGRAAFEALVRRSDVLVSNATAASLARLRCAPAELCALQPELVLCRFDAWGGPREGAGARSTHLGYDDNVQAALGIMERFGGGLGRVEEHAHIGTVDVIAGVGGALAAVAALYHVERRRRLRPHAAGSDAAGASGRDGGGLIVARASLASLGQLVQYPFCCGVPSRLAAEAQVAPSALGPECRGEHALLRCYQAADGEWLLLHASLHALTREGTPPPLAHTSVSRRPSRMALPPWLAEAEPEPAEAAAALGPSGDLSTRTWPEPPAAEGDSEARNCLEKLGAAHPALADALHPWTAMSPTASPSRSRDDAALAAALASAFVSAGLSAQEWATTLCAHSVAAVALCSLSALRSRHKVATMALDGPSYQFITEHDHPAGTALTYFAPVALRPSRTRLVVPLAPAPRYGEHTREVLAEVGADAAALVAAGVASDGWSKAYLPGHTPSIPPKSRPISTDTTVEPTDPAPAAKQRVVAAPEDERCPVCLEDGVTQRVQLACSHSLCMPCATRCGDAGHRHCPVCRTPHLLHPERLAERSTAWRHQYARWRVGGHAGAHGEVDTIRTFSPAEQVARDGPAHGGVSHSPGAGDLHHASQSHGSPHLTADRQGHPKLAKVKCRP